MRRYLLAILFFALGVGCTNVVPKDPIKATQEDKELADLREKTSVGRTAYPYRLAIAPPIIATGERAGESSTEEPTTEDEETAPEEETLPEEEAPETEESEEAPVDENAGRPGGTEVAYQFGGRTVVLFGPQETATHRCPRCGAEAEVEAKRCARCLLQFDEGIAPVEDDGASEPAVAETDNLESLPPADMSDYRPGDPVRLNREYEGRILWLGETEIVLETTDGTRITFAPVEVKIVERIDPSALAAAKEEVEKTIRCPRCATEVAGDAEACPGCLLRFTEENRALSLHTDCPRCGLHIEGQPYSCPGCLLIFGPLSPYSAVAEPDGENVICPRCEVPVTEDSLNCPNCALMLAPGFTEPGTKSYEVVKVNPGTELHCPRCQEVVGEGDLTCPTCGLELDADPFGRATVKDPGDLLDPNWRPRVEEHEKPGETEVAEEKEDKEDKEDEEVVAGATICPRCQVEIAADDVSRFCWNCSLALKEGAVLPTPGEETEERVYVVEGREKALPPDPAKFHDQLVAHIRDMDIFDGGVDHLTGADPLLEDQLREAYRRGFHYLLVPKVKKFNVQYVGINGYWAPSMATWVAVWIPSWWFPDEDYRAVVEYEMTVYHTRTGANLWSKSFTGSKLVGLDDFDRGWELWGILRVPTNVMGLDDANWDEVGRLLLGHARYAADKNFLTALKRQMPAVEPPMPSDSERYALVIGVNRYDDAGDTELNNALDDANNVARFLKTQAGFTTDLDPTGKDHVHVLLNQNATAENIRDEINRWLKPRVLETDLVLIYFAGYGWAEKSTGIPEDLDNFDKYLVTYGTDTSSPMRIKETGLGVRELMKLQNTRQGYGIGRCQQVVTILDTSFFNPQSGTRTHPQSSGERSKKEQDFLKIMAERSEGRLTICATSANQSALELGHRGGGVFTYYFLQGAEGAADTNNDKLVTLEEIVEYVDRRVTLDARRFGGRQDPWTVGDENLLEETVLKQLVPSEEVTWINKR